MERVKAFFSFLGLSFLSQSSGFSRASPEKMSKSESEVFYSCKTTAGDCTSSIGAANVNAPKNLVQADEEVNQPHENENKQKPKAVGNPSGQKKAKDSPKQRTVTPTYPPPRQFIGFVVYRKYKGVECLGTVIKYNAKKKLFIVEYKGLGEEELEMKEVLNSSATFEHVCSPPPVPQLARNSSKRPASGKKMQPSSGKKKKAAVGEGSTPPRKRRNTANRKDDVGVQEN